MSRVGSDRVGNKFSKSHRSGWVILILSIPREEIRPVKKSPDKLGNPHRVSNMLDSSSLEKLPRTDTIWA